MSSPKLDNNNNIEENDPKCKVCKKPSKDRCSRCKTARYCSRECQVSDWRTHKKTCGSSSTPVTINIEKFKCQLCSLLLVDPVTMPRCASLVCASHVTLINTNFYCDMCHMNQVKNRSPEFANNTFFGKRISSHIFEELKCNPKQL